MDERRHVHELDRDAGRERRLVVGVAGEARKQRSGPQPLAAGGERLAGDLGGEARAGGSTACASRASSSAM